MSAGKEVTKGIGKLLWGTTKFAAGLSAVMVGAAIEADANANRSPEERELRKIRKQLEKR